MRPSYEELRDTCLELKKQLGQKDILLQKAIELLRHIEWSGWDEGAADFYCPFCTLTEAEGGHSENCRLRQFKEETL